MYQVARDQHQRNQLGTAQRAYQDFVQQYPNHPQAPDALYFLGGILEDQGKPQEAVDAFNKIAELYPASPRVPEALYHAALAHIELGDRDRARVLLERVVSSHGDSMAAEFAREKLRELR
jgi:tol-pal system protein YbgF